MTHMFSTRATPPPLASRCAAGPLSAGFKAVVTGGLLIDLIVTIACGSAPVSATPSNASVLAPATEVRNEAQKVTITVGNSFSFEPATISVRAGQPVELTLACGFVPDFLLNLTQVVMFRNYGFLASIVTRVGMYLIWHVAYGNFVCAC